MLKVSIDEKLKRVCPDAVLGCLQAKVTVAAGNEQLWQELDSAADRIKQEITVEAVPLIANIRDSRAAYKALGKDPSRYRLSSEALLRRIVQGKGMYRINNVVDINNLISIASYYSVGSYDVDRLAGEVVFTVGEAGQSYKGIGKDVINIENLPVFADNAGSFGSPTSDSQRAMITEITTNILMNIISFGGRGDLEKQMGDAVELLKKYAHGQAFELLLVE